MTRHIAAAFTSGIRAHAETFTMPRKGPRVFGPRPVTLTSLPVRVIYAALVESLSEDLPESSRSPERWQAHRTFGSANSEYRADYLVEFDMAACYEYIDHNTLSQELLTRSLSVAEVTAVVELLGETFNRTLGLPQMTSVSDTLADAYLEIIERQLLRSGHHVSRYADDFKVLASTWQEATEVIEEAANHARAVGLVLTADKTRVLRRDTIEAQVEDRRRFLAERFELATEALTMVEVTWSHYDEGEVTEVPPDEEEALAEALRSILQEWYEREREEDAEQPLIHGHFLPAAVHAAQGSDERLPDDWLEQLVFRAPLSLDQVCRYLLARDEDENENHDNWRTLRRLVSMGRQSPWAKVWLLHTADTLASAETDDWSAVRAWAEQQVTERYEVVRVEAAWCVAGWKGSSEAELSRLYGGSSTITRSGMAATLGRLSEGSKTAFTKAVLMDGPLSTAAFKWGSEQE